MEIKNHRITQVTLKKIAKLEQLCYLTSKDLDRARNWPHEDRNVCMCVCIHCFLNYDMYNEGYI